MSPTDFEHRLRRELRDLASHAPETPTRGLVDPMAAYPARDHRHSLPKILTVCAAMVVVVGLIVLLARSREDATPVVTDSTVAPITTSIPPTTTTGPSPAIPTGAATTVPDGPGYGSLFPAMVWTGDELIIWGGEVVSEQEWSGRGGAYDPTTSTWRELAPSPLPPMSEQTAVWTGDEMIVCCGRIPQENGVEAAAYRPATDTWRTIAAPPFDDAPFAQSVWTGTEMIVTGGSYYRGASAYDPASDTWRTLADPPGTIERQADSAWTGEVVVAWNRSVYADTTGYTYDPGTDRWETLPAMPEELHFEGGTATVIGDDLIVWGAREGSDGLGRPAGAQLDLRQRIWTPVPDAPLDRIPLGTGSFTSPSSTTTATGEMLIHAGGLRSESDDPAVARLLAYDPATRTWRVVGTSPTAYAWLMVRAGDRAFGLGDDLVAITP